MKRVLLILLVGVWMVGNLFAESVDKQAIFRVADKVFEYQQANPVKAKSGAYKEQWEWEYGAYYSGLFDWYRVDPQVKYIEAMVAMGEEYKWAIRPRPYDANVLAIGHMYLGLYKILKNPEMLDKTAYCLDAAFVRHPKEPDVTFEGNRYWFNWWSWCDALFMAPPTFTLYAEVSGQRKYLDKMHELWQITYEYLYDKEEHLYYRDDRYFKQQTPSGKKVFWSRGNGWVIAGLAKVLQSMPKDYEHYPFYLNLFKEMAYKVKSVQLKEGYWPSSLLDANHFGGKETSGTGFFCYALAWGVNNGILPEKEFAPCALKAWNMLVSCVDENGRLGYVQRVGDSPAQVLQEHTEAYGSGAFLMAASEVYKFYKTEIFSQEINTGSEVTVLNTSVHSFVDINGDKKPELRHNYRNSRFKY